MSNFVILRRHDIKAQNMCAEKVLHMLKAHLGKYYTPGNIKFKFPDSNKQLPPTGLRINGHLNVSYERAVTKAQVQVRASGNQLSYRADGTNTIGTWTYLWLFTGIFFILYLFNELKFWFWHLRPKIYFKEAFCATLFELGNCFEGSFRWTTRVIISPHSKACRR